MIKLGKVAYLNTLPMFYRLLGYEIIQKHPSELFSMLKADKIDIGILSSAVYLSDKNQYDFVEGISISGKKMVCSVLLFLKDSDIKNVYLTNNSVASRVLTRWYIEHILKLNPHYVEEEEKADTILYIGDKAIEESTKYYTNIIDLGEEWYKAYNLGFVFALLTYKKSNPNIRYFNKLQEDIIGSIDYFYQKLKNDEIEEDVYKQYNFVDKTFFRKYFLDCLDLGLGKEQKESLAIFEGFVKKFGLT